MKRNQSNALHKKRFGQYFSGKAVADMLFSLLPKERTWETVVDPMAGIGDMLASVQDRTSSPEMLGVEIDGIVARDCAARITITGQAYFKDRANKSIEISTTAGNTYRSSYVNVSIAKATVTSFTLRFQMWELSDAWGTSRVVSAPINFTLWSAANCDGNGDMRFCRRPSARTSSRRK